MSIDFSPKGGPSDVDAYLTPSGDIRFTGDNYWERTSYVASFAGDFVSSFTGSFPPRFPTRYQSVHIEVSENGVDATLSSPAWGRMTALGTISFNQLNANLGTVGGERNTLANLTEAGNIQWLVDENMWERPLAQFRKSL
jgi:hypothetical protein